MLILGIETSCDETSSSIINISKKRIELLSNVISSSVSLHAKTGGIIPENAARQQLLYIMPVIEESFRQAKLNFNDFPVEKIAVTNGPGLIGSLLIGVETARILSYLFKKELISVNHLFGHIYANWIDRNLNEVKFPAVALVVSGGHTDILLMKSHKNVVWLGGTRDDAAGEALDKIGRVLGLPYPGGPAIEKAALRGDSKTFSFPSPLINSNDFDFSFSGLKTAVFREISKKKKVNEKTLNNLSASSQKAIVDVLIKKTTKAAEKFKARSIVIGGGVTANQKLRDELTSTAEKMKLEIFAPKRNLSTDNGAMIAAAGALMGESVNWKDIDANPGLYF